MLRNKYIKISVSALLILIALWVATPKVYIHDLLNHDHSGISAGTETNVKSTSTDDCDFEKYNKPVYFNLFKFINSFIPQRQPESISVPGLQLNFTGLSYAISFLRGPPFNQ